jgi:hypothetical protein
MLRGVEERDKKSSSYIVWQIRKLLTAVDKKNALRPTGLVS